MGKVVFVNLVSDGVNYSDESKAIFWKIQQLYLQIVKSYDEGPQERVDQAVVEGANWN